MEAADPAAKSSALETELAAKSSRIAELEARVAFLEAENARLRKAMSKGGGADCIGAEDPAFGRLEVSLSGYKRDAVERVRGGASCDVVVVSDDEEGRAVAASIGRSAEKGVVAVPTPRKRAVRAVTGESEDEGDMEEGEGVKSVSNKGIVRCDSIVGLEDDDVSITGRGKKRARVVTSDSEDEAESGGEPGKDDDGDQKLGVKSGRKRSICGISDSENEDISGGVRVVSFEHLSCVVATEIGTEDDDDRIPICQVLKKMRKERVSDDELIEAKGCSTPVTRRSARLVKNQSKRGRAARRALDFVEPKEYEGSEDDMEEDNDMREFINDEDSSENASDSAEESCAEPEVSGASSPNEESSSEPEESDNEINYEDVIASIGRKKKAKDWKFEGDMLSAFHERPELCLKAVCALYRRQTKDEQLEKSTFIHNKEGFNQIHAPRASRIAEFLLDGDPYGPLKKTVCDLEAYDRYALEFCHNVASHYSKQLFAIYQNKEDPYFVP